jgi:hypothetical protein
MQNKRDYFEEFKPIRNKIKKLNLSNSLNKLYLLLQKKPMVIVPEIAEFLFINLILYAEGPQSENGEKYWNRIVHDCMVLKDAVTTPQINSDVWRWLHTVALNQLKAHSNYYFNSVYRYYFIFSDVKISQHIEERLGMPYKSYFMCGLWLHSVFCRKFEYPKSYFTGKNNGGPAFSKENMEKTLNLLSLGIPLKLIRRSAAIWKCVPPIIDQGVLGGLTRYSGAN